MAKDSEDMVWKEVKHLGAGGFGSVNLWRNTVITNSFVIMYLS